ncbi:cell division suppressor protein YneA [Neobacillus sp. LXY-1]|uniref:cell division suppressor protein YneA n=1 Tax=Neobacillus sp. LXY-1 TaxID=3379133 RepID=UPI003EE36805
MKKLWSKYSFTIILVILSCSLAFILSVKNQTIDQDKYVKVTVSEGDSLWKISKQYSGLHSLSNEEFVNWVKKHNENIGEEIYPGEKIMIPVSKDETTNQFASVANE